MYFQWRLQFACVSRHGSAHHLTTRVSLGYQDAIPATAQPELRTIDYRLGELFCIVTDGFTDQIGSWDGNSKLSYGYRRLEFLLVAQANASAS